LSYIPSKTNTNKGHRFGQAK